MNVEVARRLAEARRARGITQEELAGRLGVSRQAVSNWERGEASPDTDNLIALARLYGMSLDDLLGVERDDAGAGDGVDAAAPGNTQEPYASSDLGADAGEALASMAADIEQGKAKIRAAGKAVLALIAIAGIALVVSSLVSTAARPTIVQLEGSVVDLDAQGGSFTLVLDEPFRWANDVNTYTEFRVEAADGVQYWDERVRDAEQNPAAAIKEGDHVCVSYETTWMESRNMPETIEATQITILDDAASDAEASQ